MEGTNKQKLEFSYIQVLIIIVALGITGRLVMPSLGSANEQDKLSSLIDGLASVRAHIKFYRGVNNGQLPPCNSFESFQERLTTETGDYCPYIDSIPTNPFNGLNTIRFDGEEPGTGQAGWRFDTKTGQFKADDSKLYVSL